MPSSGALMGPDWTKTSRTMKSLQLRSILRGENIQSILREGKEQAMHGCKCDEKQCDAKVHGPEHEQDAMLHGPERSPVRNAE